ncbi:Uncharacterized protein Adt_18503 [Abeliophyllum distichum]|uniref:Uncharacterized protein n=1 Tax=Abeliophyllum distichum TaxID=126358 RepID=A0ABD1TJX4_9LAMI
MQHNSDKEYSIERATKLGAKVFTGVADPIVAEAWMLKTQRFFYVMGYPDDKRLRLAIFLLKEGVYDWWQSMETRYADPIVIIWKGRVRDQIKFRDNGVHTGTWASRETSSQKNRRGFWLGVVNTSIFKTKSREDQSSGSSHSLLQQSAHHRSHTQSFFRVREQLLLHMVEVPVILDLYSVSCVEDSIQESALGELMFAIVRSSWAHEKKLSRLTT